MLVAMVEDIFVFEGGKVRVTFRYADQIADLIRMSLKEGEEIKVHRKMEIFVDDEIVTPVMPNPTPPPIASTAMASFPLRSIIVVKSYFMLLLPSLKLPAMS